MIARRVRLIGLGLALIFALPLVWLGQVVVDQLSQTVTGLEVNPSTLNACDTQVHVGFTTRYAAAAGGYIVSTVRLSDLAPDCRSQVVTVQLLGANGQALGQAASHDLSGADQVCLDLTAAKVLASTVNAVGVTIATP